MKKEKKELKELYEAPLTRRTQVSLESGICSGSVTDDDGKGSDVKATQQEYVEYDFANDNSWE